MTLEAQDWELRLDEVKAITKINEEINRDFPELKNSILAYVNKVVDAIARQNFPIAIVLVDKIDPRRVDAIRDVLSGYRARIPTWVIIQFLDGSDLKCKFHTKKV